MSDDEFVRISPRTGKPLRQGDYKAGPGRGNHGPAREPSPKLQTPEPPAVKAPIHFDGNASDAHSLLRAIYQDTSLPLYARMDAARIAIKHETPTLSASRTEIGAIGDFAERLRDARMRAMRGELSDVKPPDRYLLIEERKSGRDELDTRGEPAADE